MGVTGHSGIEVRQAGNRLIFRTGLVNSFGTLLASGTTALRIYEMQDDGSLNMFDFNDNTFKTATVTTPTVNMVPRGVNAPSENTGIWTHVLSGAAIAGFTAGAVYMARINNTDASPNDTYQEFQYGGAASDEERDVFDFLLGVHKQNLTTGVHTFLRRDGSTTLVQRSLTRAPVGGETIVTFDSP